MDSEKFNALAKKFFFDMEKIRDVDTVKIGAALTDLCRFLRIAGVETDYFENPAQLRKGTEVHICFFRDGEYGDCLSIQESAPNSHIDLYRFYQHKGQEKWSGEEEEKIRSLEKVLSVFNSRIRATRLVAAFSYSDPRSGFCTRADLAKRLISLAARKQSTDYAAVYFNLTGFSLINKMMTRQEATDVMKRFVDGALRLGGEGAFAARLDGVNFVLVFKKNETESVRKYLAGTNIPYGKSAYDSQNGGAEIKNEVRISARAGCFFITEEMSTPEEIMDATACAYNESCKPDSENFVFFRDELLQEKLAWDRIEQKFPLALKNGEFKAYYQPKVSLENYKLCGAEALCRWQSGDQFLRPDEFIPVLESTRDICELDFYMLERVCRDLREWLDAGKKPVRVSVNLSRCNLRNANVLEKILSTVDKYKLPHEFLEIELTETATDTDFGDLRPLVEGLGQHGIWTAIDDFGCGYSSLNLMRELPWHVLKIDKSFLSARGHETAAVQQAVLSHVIAMAQAQGLQCIAEGVETLEHISFLKKNNCLVAQGYYFDKPLPKAEFSRRL